MGATWRSRPPNVCQQIGVSFRDVEVVGLNRDRIECPEKLSSCNLAFSQAWPKADFAP
jgi:hypothetical protein